MRDDQSDSSSTFTYEDGGTPHSIDILQLRKVVSEHMGTPCTITKMAEGGFHKVYDISADDGRCIQAVVRVAAPAFPRDKMDSEVATLKYIAKHTSLPVPKVYTWNTNATNPVGAEYMIMEKVR
jgi:Ser/Thr protein kinase RdoA (MazF antagonist)